MQFKELETAVDFETAISMLEAGEASEAIIVDLGGGVLARADGRLGLRGLLQRLRGHRMLLNLSDVGATSDVVLPMRSGAPEMHPDVAVILDALNARR